MPVFLSDQIEQIERRSVKIICPGLSYMDGLKEPNLSAFVDCREFLCKRFYVNNFGSPSNISDLLPKKNLHLYNFRNLLLLMLWLFENSIERIMERR